MAFSRKALRYSIPITIVWSLFLTLTNYAWSYADGYLTGWMWFKVAATFLAPFVIITIAILGAHQERRGSPGPPP